MAAGSSVGEWAEWAKRAKKAGRKKVPLGWTGDWASLAMHDDKSGGRVKPCGPWAMGCIGSWPSQVIENACGAKLLLPGRLEGVGGSEDPESLESMKSMQQLHAKAERLGRIAKENMRSMRKLALTYPIHRPCHPPCLGPQLLPNAAAIQSLKATACAHPVPADERRRTIRPC